MQQTLRIEELREPYWKLIASVTAILSVALFTVYWNMPGGMWAGIVRLASFASFAGAVLSGLKAMDGGLDIELQVRNGSLLLRYLKKGDTVRKEEHKLSDIKSISCAEARFTLSPEPNSLFIIRFTDSEESFDLLHFSGRPLKIGRENTDKLLRFFEEQGIETDRS